MRQGLFHLPHQLLVEIVTNRFIVGDARCIIEVSQRQNVLFSVPAQRSVPAAVVLLVNEKRLQQPSHYFYHTPQQPLDQLPHLLFPRFFPNIAKLHVQGENSFPKQVIDIAVELRETVLDGIENKALARCQVLTLFTRCIFIKGGVLGAIERLIDLDLREQDVAGHVTEVPVLAVEQLLLHFLDLAMEICSLRPFLIKTQSRVDFG